MLISKSLAFFLLSLLPSILGIDPSVKGDKCSGQDLCSTNKDALRTCECHKDCYKYGTCCTDAESFSLMTSENQEYHCYDDKITTPVFAKRSCAENFNKHISHISACFAEGDKKDILGNLLVTSKTTSITYWNKDCAICSNEAENDLKPWSLQVICPKAYNGMSIREHDIKKNLTFNVDKEEWGLVVKEDFVNCSINIREPNEAEKLLRYCAPKMIDTCPPNHEDDELKQRCAMYHGERKLKGGESFFKNVHCALCNKASLKELECDGRNYKSKKKETTQDTLKVKFDEGKFSELLGDARFVCSENYGYDSFWKKCRERKLILLEPRSNGARTNSAVFVMLFFSVIFACCKKFF